MQWRLGSNGCDPSLMRETREYTLFAPQISLVTQCDVKRFRERIPEMMRVWRGPMVVAVMLRSTAEMEDVLATVKENQFLEQCAPHTPRWMSACGANRQRLNGQFTCWSPC